MENQAKLEHLKSLMQHSFIVRVVNRRFLSGNGFFLFCLKGISMNIYVHFVPRPLEQRWIKMERRIV